MRSIGWALAEMFGVLAAGFVGFFVLLAYMAGLLVWLACGVACFCLLLVALVSMVMWLFTRDAHAFHVMLGYFAYAGGAYAVIAAMSYYRSRLADLVRNRQQQRAVSNWRVQLQLAENASVSSLRRRILRADGSRLGG